MPTILGNLPTTEIPVRLSNEDRAKGVYIIGQMGTGKSNLLKTMIIQDMLEGKGICVLDPHGDLINEVLPFVHYKYPDALISLDPSNTDRPFGLNIFECPDPQSPAARSLTVNYVISLFKKLWGDPRLGVNIHDVMAHISHVFVRSQKYTLVDVPLFLENARFRAKVLDETPLPPPIRQFWDSYNERTDQRTYIASTLNKVRDFTNSELLYPILGQSRSTFNINDVLDNHRILLVKLAEGLIGEEPASLLGNIITGQVLQAMLYRTGQDKDLRHPFALYCDEYQLFASSDFNRFFSEGRKFGIHVTVAHQWRGQLDTSARDATAAVANRITFRVSPNDATELKRWYKVPDRIDNAPLSRRPLEYLMKNGHTDYAANELGKRFARFISGRSAYITPDGGGEIGRFIAKRSIERWDTEVPKALDAINHYIYTFCNKQYTSMDSMLDALLVPMQTIIQCHPISSQLGIPPRTKVLMDKTDFVLVIFTHTPEDLAKIIRDHSNLPPISPLVELLWLIARTSFYLASEPIRDYSNTPKPEPFDLGSILADLPIGIAYAHLADGSASRDTIISIPFVKSIAHMSINAVSTNPYLEEVDREIYQRQKLPPPPPSNDKPRIRRTT